MHGVISRLREIVCRYGRLCGGSNVFLCWVYDVPVVLGAETARYDVFKLLEKTD